MLSRECLFYNVRRMTYKSIVRKIPVALLTSLFFCFIAEAAYGSQIETLLVSPLSWKILVFNLKGGDKFTGSLSISGGAGNDIDFWITDPTGVTIRSYGRVSIGRTFEFQATQDGAYTLHFDNSFSIISSKTVTLTYDIERPLLEIFSPVIGIAAVVVVILVVLAMIARPSRERTRSAEPGPPSYPPPINRRLPPICPRNE